MIEVVHEPGGRPPRPARSETREVVELKALASRQPELSEAVAMHLEIVELYRRIQPRVPLPCFDLSTERLADHNGSGQPLVRFEDIPLELTDLRLMVRQTADVLRRHGALDDADYNRIQTIGRDLTLVQVVKDWYGRIPDRHTAPAVGAPHVAAPAVDTTALDQVLSIAMKPFLSRCAEVLQQSSDLHKWTRGYCALCGSEPDFAVITPAAERHLLCGRCGLRWKFEPLTCPYCLNADRSRITSFATPNGQYRVYACDVCHRYLKAYDGRRAARQLMPLVDSIATLPLDAAAMQRGYQ